MISNISSRWRIASYFPVTKGYYVPMFRIAVMVFLIWGGFGGLVSIVRGIYFWGWGANTGILAIMQRPANCL